MINNKTLITLKSKVWNFSIINIIKYTFYFYFVSKILELGFKEI